LKQQPSKPKLVTPCLPAAAIGPASHRPPRRRPVCGPYRPGKRRICGTGTLLVFSDDLFANVDAHLRRPKPWWPNAHNSKSQPFLLGTARLRMNCTLLPLCLCCSGQHAASGMLPQSPECAKIGVAMLPPQARARASYRCWFSHCHAVRSPPLDPSATKLLTIPSSVTRFASSLKSVHKFMALVLRVRISPQWRILADIAATFHPRPSIATDSSLASEPISRLKIEIGSGVRTSHSNACPPASNKKATSAETASKGAARTKCLRSKHDVLAAAGVLCTSTSITTGPHAGACEATSSLPDDINSNPANSV